MHALVEHRGHSEAHEDGRQLLHRVGQRTLDDHQRVLELLATDALGAFAPLPAATGAQLRHRHHSPATARRSDQSRRLRHHPAADTRPRRCDPCATRTGNWRMRWHRCRCQQQSLELAQESLRNTQARVDIGTTPPIDIVEAQSEVATRQEAVIVAAGADRRGRGRAAHTDLRSLDARLLDDAASSRRTCRHFKPPTSTWTRSSARRSTGAPT